MGTSSVNFSEFSVHRSVFAKNVNSIREQNTAKVWTLKTALQTISDGAHARVGRLSFHLTPEMRPIGCSETSARNYHYSLRNSPEERVLLYFAAEAWNLRYVQSFLSLVSMLWLYSQTKRYVQWVIIIIINVLACACSRPTCHYNRCVVYGMDIWTSAVHWRGRSCNK
jgi:hypothetical protein